MRYEAETAPGIADIAEREIREQCGAAVTIHRRTDDAVQFTYAGQAVDLLSLQTVIAVYSVQHFSIPRPKALLGHQNFHRLLDQLRLALNVVGHNHYATLYLSAAGSGTRVMQRIKDDLADHLQLHISADEGDVLLRIRPSTYKEDGWETLVRLTPRPLATREWRVCNMPGALNASVAHAMVRLSQPRPTDTVLNLACGSGTLLVERQAHSLAGQLLGVDIDVEALSLAQENLHAADINATLLQGDATALSLPDASIDVLYADLPFGQLVGSHADNLTLYPALLAEAARVARAGARFVVITHEITLMQDCLANHAEWHIIEMRKITLSGLHPRIFVLERI